MRTIPFRSCSQALDVSLTCVIQGASPNSGTSFHKYHNMRRLFSSRIPQSCASLLTILMCVEISLTRGITTRRRHSMPIGAYLDGGNMYLVCILIYHSSYYGNQLYTYDLSLTVVGPYFSWWISFLISITKSEYLQILHR